jgi:hypothetical protein
MYLKSYTISLLHGLYKSLNLLVNRKGFKADNFVAKGACPSGCLLLELEKGQRVKALIVRTYSGTNRKIHSQRRQGAFQ